MTAHPPLAPGLFHSSLVDQEIAHIRRVMPSSLTGDLGGPILPPDYWRRRLAQLVDTGMLTKSQLAQVDSLLARLAEHERAAAAGDGDDTGTQPAPTATP